MREKEMTIEKVLEMHKKGYAAVIKSGKLIGFEEEDDETRQKDVPRSCRSDDERGIAKLRTEYERLADVAFGELYRKARKGIMGHRKW